MGRVKIQTEVDKNGEPTYKPGTGEPSVLTKTTEAAGGDERTDLGLPNHSNPDRDSI